MKKLLLISTFLISPAQAADINVWVRAGQSLQYGTDTTSYVQQFADTVIRLYPELGASDTSQVDGTLNEFPIAQPSLPRYAQTVTRVPYDNGAIHESPVNGRIAGEVNFGRKLYVNYGGGTILKFAVGSSNAEESWVNSDSVDLADRLIIFMAQMRAQLEANGDVVRWRGFLFNQGTSDVNLGTGASYAANLDTIISKVRWFTEDPALPVVITRTYVDIDALGLPAGPKATRQASLDTVRAAQTAWVAADPCAYLVNMDDIPLRDAFHPADGEYDVLGHRDFVGYAAIIARPACTASPALNRRKK